MPIQELDLAAGEADYIGPITITVNHDITTDAIALGIGTEEYPNGTWYPSTDSVNTLITRPTPDSASLALFIGGEIQPLTGEYFLYCKLSDTPATKVIRLRRFAIDAGTPVIGGDITYIDNGDGTITWLTGVVDNGDGTFTLTGDNLTDNGDGTFTVAA